VTLLIFAPDGPLQASRYVQMPGRSGVTSRRPAGAILVLRAERGPAPEPLGRSLPALPV